MLLLMSGIVRRVLVSIACGRLHRSRPSSGPHTEERNLNDTWVATNSIMIHAYPSLERVAEIRDAHDSRVLFSCAGPAGDVVCTGAGDENLKFWRIWEVASQGTKKKVMTVGDELGGRNNSTKEGILSLC